MLWAILMGILCYLIGAVPFPVLVSRWTKGIDLRDHDVDRHFSKRKGA